MYNKICSIVFFLCVFSGAVFADPVVISVDNSQLASGKLTINGSGFGSHAATVKVYDRFESDTAKAGEIIPLTSPEIGEWSGYGTYPPLYSSISHSGRFGMQIHTKVMRQIKLDFTPGIQEIFLSYWVRLPDGQIFPGSKFHDGKAPETFSDDSSWKFTWLYDLDYFGGSSDLCLPTHVGGGTFWLAGNDFNLDTHIGNKGTWWSWKSWMRISVWLRAGADPVVDGDVMFQTISAEKGVRELRLSKPIFDSDFGGVPGAEHVGVPDIKQYQHLNFPGWIRSGTGEGTTPIYDDIYVAVGKNSMSRVELVNSPDYKKATKVAIQKVTAWSDGQIKIEIVSDGFGNNLDKSAFIFVWDKDGNRNTVGLPVKAYPKHLLVQ